MLVDISFYIAYPLHCIVLNVLCPAIWIKLFFIFGIALISVDNFIHCPPNIHAMLIFQKMVDILATPTPGCWSNAKLVMVVRRQAAALMLRSQLDSGLPTPPPSHNWGKSLYSVDKNKDKDKDKPFVYSRPPPFTQILGTGYRVQYHTQNNIIDHYPTKSV